MNISEELKFPVTVNLDFLDKYYYNTFGKIIIETLVAFDQGDIEKYKKLKSLEINLIILRNSGKRITKKEYKEIENYIYSINIRTKGINEIINYIIYKIGYILLGK